MLMLMSTQFSLAYTCACAYAHVLVKAGLKEKKKIHDYHDASVNKLCNVTTQEYLD